MSGVAHRKHPRGKRVAMRDAQLGGEPGLRRSQPIRKHAVGGEATFPDFDVVGSRAVALDAYDTHAGKVPGLCCDRTEDRRHRVVDRDRLVLEPLRSSTEPLLTETERKARSAVQEGAELTRNATAERRPLQQRDAVARREL